jgi:hypothetical protein
MEWSSNVNGRRDMAYKISHRMFSKFQVVIDWFILSEKRYINKGQNLSHYIVMMQGMKIKKYAD